MEHPLMAALRITARVGSDQDPMDTDHLRKAPPVGMFLAVGAKEGSSIFVAMITSEERESGSVLSWQKMDCSPGSGTLEW
jgi:hypothetical protein